MSEFKKIGLLSKITGSRLVKSSMWGIGANLIQSILLSLFFIILSRKYSKDEFAVFLIASTLYQFFAAFSTLGLGQWFTREIIKTENKESLINKFMKMQIFSGFFFYLICILLAFALYDDVIVRYLALLLGINILFDNIIYAIRSLNIAEFKQEKTFVILLIDSLLKFLAACILFIYPAPVLVLCIILIITRFVTLNIFLVMGSSRSINIKKLIAYKISWKEMWKIVSPNWAFIIIGSVSMIYWRIGNLIISKMMDYAAVANYEVSYKIFSLSIILPLIISSTVFPSLVEIHKSGDTKKFNKFFHNVFLAYVLYSLLVYTFFYSFSDYIIPFAFGEKYLDNPPYTRQMFLAILVFPTALLQANVLVALHKEKKDMWLNIISLIINVIICIVGLIFYKSLLVVNLAIFISFLVFHVCQDYLLIKYKITSIKKVVQFYLVMGVIAGGYVLLNGYINPVLQFIISWAFILFIILFFIIKPSGIKQLLGNTAPFKKNVL